MQDQCMGDKVVIVSCPGGSNVSLISYKVASRLEKEGYGKFVRLGGENFKDKDRQRLKDADAHAEKWLLIDGCTKGCGKDVFESAGLRADHYVVVANLGIERENKIDFTDEEVEKVLIAAKAVLGDGAMA